MSTQEEKISPEEARAMESWRGRWLLDGFENSVGLVRDVSISSGVIELVVVFDDGDRFVSTEEQNDGEFVHPDLVRARYRILSEEEARDRLRKSRSKRSS